MTDQERMQSALLPITDVTVLGAIADVEARLAILEASFELLLDAFRGLLAALKTAGIKI